ncbi:ImmA/IrrE family metallo-endopeptidase [Corynebacterium heidelbergense]|uniref:ImmA/IrrE family metallo-endopeptidase n=1 Tax=Corynebacterium heidelbergense TaxID=2055947 RepID=A0A364VE87_9CORY|nr:ImmA/IrrE family metallo-endopeptidase [Corynebacterium heidelbergense]RAV34876.1 ImmA/IrrE family metallo-endopeptidase [Corynebacterium heidelbergense]WCZ36011.1 hypothetical protein CHEID_02220 [Corynebacterium heidelbergense]
MTDFTDLQIMADMLQVNLTKHDQGPPGYYHHATRTISTRRGMSARQYRSTLAHELGHAAYGDTPTLNTHYSQRQERRADKFAAHLLITTEAFCDAYAWAQGNFQEIADELEVNQRILRAWIEGKAA